MAHQAYMTLQFQKQGKITGGSSKHKPGWIPVLAFDFNVETPRDASSGQASGKRQHKPITIVKEEDQATPLLWSAVCNNEVLRSVLFEMASKDQSGKEAVYQTIELTNGTICGIEKMRGQSGELCERITLRFENSSANKLGLEKVQHGAFLASLG